MSEPISLSIDPTTPGTISLGWADCDCDSPEWTEEEWTYNFAIIAMAQFKLLKALQENSIRVADFDLIWDDGTALAFVDLANAEDAERALDLARQALGQTADDYDRITGP
ncbi:hypothetical protein CH249_15355 [Rhodococcus sp. 05-2255-3B1]|uniref:hypothetical protein n=1 Tax=unclassified Rhodococcus (in: high G+C Gram-positive bacteria) TaxID=192944 RepID=UPI000B9C1FE2|nr:MULTISPECIES: hypothetical protein [unclassified Rhodococcus (in: high G+C Gram-positive bacteria)]OZE03167.1 hypothetical protein CH250_23420 [Rhodococcus sp. 05-2255-3C]OZE09556.1 hypothetical protein CH249_15355 [Rhodococcus sp. 05-2255-3B1]OZE14822.1 hypothetical protein CH255_21700 [Rhodococcus sp. 05-2255-2A2]